MKGVAEGQGKMKTKKIFLTHCNIQRIRENCNLIPSTHPQTQTNFTIYQSQSQHHKPFSLSSFDPYNI